MHVCPSCHKDLMHAMKWVLIGAKRKKNYRQNEITI